MINDSVLKADIELKEIAGCYPNDNTVDFYISKRARFSKNQVKIQILFIRKKNFIFTLVLSPKQTNSELDPHINYTNCNEKYAYPFNPIDIDKFRV